MNAQPSRREFLMQAGAVVGAGLWPGLQVAAASGSTPSNAAPQIVLNDQAGAAESAPVPLAPPDRQPPALEVPEVPPRKVGWAVVGLGELALNEIMPAFRQSRLSRPVALVSGHPEKARKVAEVYGIESKAIFNYENFEEIARDPQVEVVYIVLPNSMHAEYSVRALQVGKHVLCEKPMAVTVEEGKRMIDAAAKAQRKLGVGYRLHHEPLTRRVIQYCKEKEFGQIKTISSSNCQNVPAPNIRLSAALGGGPLGDVGIYSINAARTFLGEEPVEVTAFAHQPSDDPRFREVPESVSFILRFSSGVLAHCDCSFGTVESRRFRIHCSEGFIEMDPAFSYRGLRLRVKRGDVKDGTAENAEVLLEPVNHFAAEMDHFSDCILNGGELRTPGEMGLADLKVMAAIEQALHSGRSVHLPSV